MLTRWSWCWRKGYLLVPPLTDAQGRSVRRSKLANFAEVPARQLWRIARTGSVDVEIPGFMPE
jgi:hypothetical protein